MKLNPLADLVLPLLLTASAGITISLTAGSLGLATAPLFGFWAFLFAAESCLFTTLFTVRDLDAPGALRWVEIILMLLLAKVIGAVPVSDGLLGAILEPMTHIETLGGMVFLGIAWYLGLRSAMLLGPLHPERISLDPNQEQVRDDEHGIALSGLRTLVLGQVAAMAPLVSIAGYARQQFHPWAWNWPFFGVMLLAVIAAVVMLAGAQLRQQITWMVEGLPVPRGLFTTGWIPAGISLILMPLLLALLLPAGPRVPVERLFPTREPFESAQPPRPPAEQPAQPDPMTRMLEEWLKDQQEWQYAWLLPIIMRWLVIAAAVGLMLALLRAAARQLAERLGKDQLQGAWKVAGTLAAWYLALWQLVGVWLGKVVRQAAAAPAEAVGAFLGETGPLGRFSPFRGRVPADPRAALRYFFRRLQHDAARRGIRRAGSDTAAEYAARLAEAAPDQREEIAALVQAYEAARYSAEPVPAERVSFARRAWAEIARALKATRK